MKYKIRKNKEINFCDSGFILSDENLTINIYFFLTILFIYCYRIKGKINTYIFFFVIIKIILNFMHS